MDVNLRTKSKRLDVEDLYILGAGSSYALSKTKTKKEKYNRNTTPLDYNFLSLIEKDVNKRLNGWQKEAFKVIKEQWLDKNKDFLIQGLEQAIVQRTSNYELLNTLHPRLSSSKKSNETYVNTLSHLIADYLKKCKSNNSTNTKTFVNSIFPPRKGGKDINDYRNRVISFNYDTIIDRQLLDRGISIQKIYFDKIEKIHKSRTTKKTTFSNPLLLKMHGSLNWRCERSYFDKIINGCSEKNEITDIWYDDRKCPSPQDDLSPLIIPPIPNKPITKSSVFSYIWIKAFEYIHDAKRIIIAGYSCPETDLLARSFFQQFRNKQNLKEVIVIDPSTQVLEKYINIMGTNLSKNVKWIYYRDFNDYIESTLKKQ